MPAASTVMKHHPGDPTEHLSLGHARPIVDNFADPLGSSSEYATSKV